MAKTKEEFAKEYNRLYKWRDLWIRLSNRDSKVYPQKGNSGARRSQNAVFLASLQTRQEAVQRRAKIADNKIRLLLLEIDAHYEAEKAAAGIRDRDNDGLLAARLDARAKIRARLGEAVGLGVLTSLQNNTKSSYAIEAWKAIRKMPGAEWEHICEIVAEQILTGIIEEINPT
jgi:hypothetical protein